MPNATQRAWGAATIKKRLIVKCHYMTAVKIIELTKCVSELLANPHTQLAPGQGADGLGRGGKAAGRCPWDLTRDPGLRALLWSQEGREGRGESGWLEGPCAAEDGEESGPCAGFLFPRRHLHVVGLRQGIGE